MNSIDIRSALDVVPERSAPAPAAARRRGWQTTLLRVVGGFALTGFFLALSVAAFAFAGIYAFLEFAKLY
ncbi:MAG TPA: hypothetical protein VKV32_14410 [Stellaceae bacterium]|nr:hypothetical protein [Stellaceae bacterium]